MTIEQHGSTVRAGSGGAAIALSMRGVSKTFPGTRALDNVGLDVHHGEIHGLCGGNGSGKSTLIKILCGVYHADTGSILIGGQELEAAQMRPNVAHDLGVRVVHQDFAVFPDLSIAENMTLGAEFPTSVAGNVRWREVRRRARVQIERFEIAGDPDALVRDLPVAARSQIAIARALQDLGSGEGVLILDEPTVALPRHEVGLLLTAVRRLAETGQAVIFISHRLDEVMDLTDRVTVLRDGQVAAEHRTEKLTEKELIEAILGRRSQQARARRVTVHSGEPVLRIRGLRAGPLLGVDLDVFPGEVVGVAGLLGSGRTELLRAVYGDLPINEGDIEVSGKPANFKHVEEAIGRGVVMIPENRSEAIFSELSVNENLDIGVLPRYWHGWFRGRSLRTDAAALREQFKVRAASGSVEIKSLSGGNQQKTVLARWLRRDPLLLLLDEPTQGVDVGARGDIHAAIRKVTEAGGAAVLVLSDLEELAQVADRSVVLNAGRVTAHVSLEQMDAQYINELIYKTNDSSNGREAGRG
jgi:ribose transport system ATP-binding protein